MSILIGIGIVTTVTTFYLGRKGWHALHKMVGITPGVLTYQDDNAPLSLTSINWQQLNLNKKHLKVLPDNQLRQLHRIDEKVSNYQSYQKALQAQNKTPALTEQQFVLNKLLHTRLPEMLVSHYQLVNMIRINNEMNQQKKSEASELLQGALNNIEHRLDTLLKQIEVQQLQELQVMNNYMNSHDS